MKDVEAQNSPQQSSGETQVKKAKTQKPGGDQEDEPIPEGDPVIVSNKPGLTKEQRQLQAKILKIEGNNFDPKKITIVLGVLLVSLLVIFLRGGPDLDSIVGIERCDGWDWTFMSLYIVAIGIFGFLGYTVVLGVQKMKEVSKWEYHPQEKKFDKNFLIQGNIIGFIAGLAAALVGIGGGTVKNPILLKFKFLPQVISFTSMYLILANKIVIDIEFILAGVMPIQYMLFIGGILAVGVLLVEWKLGQIVRKLGRQSYISFLFAGLLVIALVLVIIVGIDTTKKTLDDDEKGLLDFVSFCN